MVRLLISFAPRVLGFLAVVFALLISSFAADAGISEGLRNLLQAAMAPDLRVDSFTLDRSQATVGDTLRATVRISNHGRGAATSTILNFWAAPGSSTSPDNAYRLATVRLGTLHPNAGLTSVNTFPVPNLSRLGTYKIFATVESASAEVKSRNNSQARALQVIGPDLPDAKPIPVANPDAGTAPPPASTSVANGGSSSPAAPAPPVSSGSVPRQSLGVAPPPASNVGSSSPPPASSSPAPASSSPAPASSNPGPVATAPPASNPGSGGSVSDPRADCDYYASPTGRGDGNNPESPFRIQTFWRVAAPGKTLCLLDGIYTGADSMIAPRLQGAPTNLSGANRSPIKIRALNDGAVLIDGQFSRRPIQLYGNSWFVIEGVNAARSNGSVVGVYSRSDNNILRRIVMWDANSDQNNNTFGWADSSNNLLEDIAVFGTGRKSLNPFGDSYGNVFRRIWARWEGSTTIGPKYCAALVYNKSPESMNGNIFENFICTWSGESQPQAHSPYNTATGESGSPLNNFAIEGSGFSLFGRDNLGGTDSQGSCHNVKVLGSIGYLKSSVVTTNAPQSSLVMLGTNSSTDFTRIASCFTFKDVLIVVDSAKPDFASHRGFSLGSTGHTNIATNISTIAGNKDIFGSFETSNNAHAASLAGLNALGANPWTGTTGANLCKRYVNGVKTNEPLWPWPMNERIKRATASAGRYTGPCATCEAGRYVRSATDVTAEIQELLGPISAQCKK